MNKLESDIHRGGAGSLIPPGGHEGDEHKRRVWDPRRSTLVQEVLNRLVERYHTQELTAELSPKVLIQLGGDFGAFYHAAFHNTSRAVWAMERFPKGFQSLVDELNTRLSPYGIDITNSKTEVGLYGKMTKSSREVIKVIQAVVRTGELSKEQAIAVLRSDFRIVLSAAQQAYYFSGDVAKAPPSLQSIDQRKLALVARIEDVKNRLGVNLSMRDCIKGLTFEAFVGVCLAYRYGADAVTRQRELPIVYRDLGGKLHRRVYLDFLVKDSPSQFVFEVKYRNSWDNILNSFLAQLAAFEQLTKQPERITVIYRHPCPLMRFAYDSNVSVSEEASTMELDALSLSKRTLRQMVRYVSVEEFLDQEGGEPAMGAFLHSLDTFLDNADTERLRECEDALIRIAGSPESIPEQLLKLQSYIVEGNPITPAEAQRIFGRKNARVDGGNISLDARAAIIQRNLQSRRDSLLQDVYEKVFGERRPLDESTLEQLEGLSTEVFEQAAVDVIAERESKILARKARTSTRDEGSNVIAAYERITERQREQDADQAQTARSLIVAGQQDLHKKLQDAVAFATRFANTPQFTGADIQKLCSLKLLKMRPDKFGDGYNRALHRLHHAEDQAVNQMKLLHKDILGSLKMATQFWGRSSKLSIEPAFAQLKEIERRFSRELADVNREPFLAALKTAKERLAKESPLREVVLRAIGQFKSPLVVGEILQNEFYLQSVRTVCELSWMDAVPFIAGISSGYSNRQHSSLVDEVSAAAAKTFLPGSFFDSNQGVLLKSAHGLSDPSLRSEYLFGSLFPLREIRTNRPPHQPASASRALVEQAFESLTAIRNSPWSILDATTDSDSLSDLIQLLAKRMRIARGELVDATCCALFAAMDPLDLSFAQDDQAKEAQEVRWREQLPRLLTAQPDAVFEQLGSSGVLSMHLLFDQLDRALHQAGIINYFSPVLARDFFLQTLAHTKNVQASSLSNYPLSRDTVLAQVAESDKLFSALVR
jgi:hypothetical protein